MIRLFASQINRSICRLMGIDKLMLQDFEEQQHKPEITFEWDLEVMEKYDDFKFISEKMFRNSLNGEDCRTMHYDYPDPPAAKVHPAVDSPLNPAEKIVVDIPMSVFFEVNGNTVNHYKTVALLPVMSECIDKYIAQERKENNEKLAEQRKQKQAEKAERKAAAKAERAVKAEKKKEEPPKPKYKNKEEELKAKESARAVAKAYEKLGLAPDGKTSLADLQAQKEAEQAAKEAERKAAEEAAEKARLKAEAEAAAAKAAIENGEEDKVDDKLLTHDEKMMISVRESLAEKHRYKDRKLYIRILPGPNGDNRSIEWALACLHHHLIVPDEGLTDLMRDIIVYQWFENLPKDQRDLFPTWLNPEDFYKSLRLTDVVIFHDGKMMLWYECRNNICGTFFPGFGVDIDPPFKRSYAVGIKHVFGGKLAAHPTVRRYREMLASESLNEVVRDVHFCQNDNISPFSEDETSDKMSFINDAFMVFDVPIPDTDKTIEVLVKDKPELTMDDIAERLEDLRENYLADFLALNDDIIDFISEPLVEMKNSQEERRRNRDPEFSQLRFKDPIHRTEFTIEKLRKNFPLKIDRIVLAGANDLKFLIPTNLFAFTDKDDDANSPGGTYLGLVHADCIMVSLHFGNDGLEVTGIDLTDCVQIPYGNHKNEDIEVYKSEFLSSLLENKNAPIPDDWDFEWLDKCKERVKSDLAVTEKMAEARQKWDKFAQQSRAKTIATRARKRKERKKKK